MKDIIVGIDLGTTNSVIAYVKDGQPVVIKDGDQSILPSVVGLAPDGKILVGEAARNQFLIYPERTVRSIKRKMGKDERVTMGDKSYTPQEVSAIILLRLKKIAEAHLGHAVTKAVITVPAYFSDAQRKATKEAGEIAGFEVMRIINEPTAAALTYEAGHTDSKKILVYDLGGGTFDVSVVQIQGGVVEVLSGHGNNHLGGDDFDEKIVEKICAEFQEAYGVDLKSTARSHARLVRASEDAKIYLSDNPFARIQEEFIIEKNGTPLHLDNELARTDYEDLIRSYLNETLDCTHIALRGANLSAREIDTILLVGGATRTPMVAHLLAEKFGMEPKHEVSPELCVALGAAIQGAMIAGEPVSSVLVDITPYTFGTSVLGEINGMPTSMKYAPIIHKNTALPVSKSDVFYTHDDEQEAAHIKVYQGENQDARRNIFLGDFMVEGLSPVPAGNEIVIRFDLDLNGILNVTATEKITGLEKNIRIENAMSKLDAREISVARNRIAAYFDDVIEEEGSDLAAHEGIDSNVRQRAEGLIARARVKLEEARPEDRDEIETLLKDIHDGLANGDSDAVEDAMTNLEDILFFLES